MLDGKLLVPKNKRNKMGTMSSRSGAISPLSVIAPGDSAAWLRNTLSSFFQDSARTTPSANAQPIGAWADSSGLGNHYTQTTAGDRATLRLNANGFYEAEFDGISDFLTCATGGITSGNITIIAVVRQTSGSGDVWGNKSGNNGYRCGMNSGGNDGVMMVGNGTAFTSATVALAAATYGVICGQYTGTSLTAFLNNVAGTPNTATLVAGSAGASIGKAHDFAGAFYAGMIVQLFVINKFLTESQKNGISKFMGAEAGLNF